MKEGLVRADTLPLVFRVPGTESFERGTHVRARVLDVDLLTLDLHARLLQRLEEPADEGGHVDEDDDEDGDAAQSGPLTLAIDLAEPPPGAEEAAAAPPIEPALPPGGAAAP